MDPLGFERFGLSTVPEEVLEVAVFNANLTLNPRDRLNPPPLLEAVNWSRSIHYLRNGNRTGMRLFMAELRVGNPGRSLGALTKGSVTILVAGAHDQDMVMTANVTNPELLDQGVVSRTSTIPGEEMQVEGLVDFHDGGNYRLNSALHRFVVDAHLLEMREVPLSWAEEWAWSNDGERAARDRHLAARQRAINGWTLAEMQVERIRARRNRVVEHLGQGERLLSGQMHGLVDSD